MRSVIKLVLCFKGSGSNGKHIIDSDVHLSLSGNWLTD